MGARLQVLRTSLTLNLSKEVFLVSRALTACSLCAIVSALSERSCGYEAGRSLALCVCLAVMTDRHRCRIRTTSHNQSSLRKQRGMGFRDLTVIFADEFWRRRKAITLPSTSRHRSTVSICRCASDRRYLHVVLGPYKCALAPIVPQSTDGVSRTDALRWPLLGTAMRELAFAWSA